jgi:hypothetical protein
MEDQAASQQVDDFLDPIAGLVTDEIDHLFRPGQAAERAMDDDAARSSGIQK